jgi:hypothetical protein
MYGTHAKNLIGKTDADFISNKDEIDRLSKDNMEVLETWKEKVIFEEKRTDVNGNVRSWYSIKRPLLDQSNSKSVLCRFCPFLPVFCAIIHCVLVVVVIRTFGEARGPVTGTSPKLADFVRFSQFSMLLLTDFGTRGDPIVRGTPGSACGDLAKTRRFCPFLAVFYAIIHCFLVVVVVRTFGEGRGAVTETSPKLADLVHS